MFLTVRYLVVIAILSISSYATAGVLMYDDAENSPPSSKWSYNIGAVPSGMSISLSSDHAKSGSHSYKVYLPSVPSGVSYDTGAGQLHVELLSLTKVSDENWSHNFTFNKSYWVSWSVYIPSDFQFPESGAWALIGQFHNSEDSCDAGIPQPIGLYLNSGTGGVTLAIRAITAHCAPSANYDRQVSYASPAFKKGQWNDFVLNFRFSYTTGGFFKAWLNGTQFANDSGINCFNDDLGLNFRLGLYGELRKAMTMYYDDFRIGDESATFAMMSPGGASGADDTLVPPVLKIVQNP